MIRIIFVNSRQDGSDEGSQHMVLMRNKKIIIKYSLLSRAVQMRL